MANIDRIVKVDISLNTAGITSEGFSTLLIAGWHSYTTERVLAVTDSDELLGLGFDSTNPIYIAVNDALSQTPRPSLVKVGRMQCDTVRINLTGSVAENDTYTVNIKSVDSDGYELTEQVTYTAKKEDTVEKVLEGLAHDSESYTVSATGQQLYVKAKDSEHSFVVELSGKLEIDSFVPTFDSIAENMEKICSADDDFYGIVLTTREQDKILEMADWCESHTKLFGVAIAEPGAKNAEVTTDTGSKLKNGNYFRTFWYYHADAEKDYLEAAIFARCFAVLPGGETWANKRLGGVITDRLRENEYIAVTKKNGNTFEAFRNLSITQNGKVAAGEWIDVIRFRDWLVETIKTEEFVMLINRDKLPYTDNGIAIVESVLNKVLALGQVRGGIAPTEYDEDGNKNLGYEITVPLAANISPNVKASRKLEDVKFVARLAGAIHCVDIKGSLTYENLIRG